MKRKTGFVLFGLSVRVFCSYPLFFTYTNHLTATTDTLKLQRYLREVTATRIASFGPLVRVFFAYRVFFFNLFLSTSNIGATVLRRAQGKLRRGERAISNLIVSVYFFHVFSLF